MRPYSRKLLPRFGFGKNWRNFSHVIDCESIDVAARSLCDFLEVETLQGKRFIDVGCGSGLFSAAAARLGAESVYAFDYDVDSVATAEQVLSEHAPKNDWIVEHGDVLDEAYIASLGRADVVYSWGVLHHTGSMWRAIENTLSLVSDNGVLYLALYNDQGIFTRFWWYVKLAYNRLPAFLRPLLVFPYFLLSLPGAIFHHAIKPTATRHRRGMKLWFDSVDWIGGFPFEAANPGAVEIFCRDHGFTMRKVIATRGLGCNEYLLRRIPSAET